MIPPNFCMAMRKYLENGKVMEIASEPGERIVTIWTEKGGASFGLFVELFQGRSNAYIVDENNKIISVLFPKAALYRKLTQGVDYLPPPPLKIQKELEAREFGAEPWKYFEELEKRDEFDLLFAKLKRVIKKEIKRSEKYIFRMRNDLEKCEDPAVLRHKGELLSINLGKIKRGADAILVEDVFKEGAPKIELKLDPTKSGVENVDFIFKKAKRDKKKKEGLRKRIREIETILYDYQTYLGDLDQTESYGGLLDIEDQLTHLEILPVEKSTKRKKKRQSSGPKKFISADGIRILVGRNSKENDKVTFRMARGNDYWLHVHGAHGSHVVILLGKNRELKQETLLDGATLALLHSKLSKEGVGDVSYTRRKYVTKPKGAPAGLVAFSQSKTIRIRVENKRVERLMGKIQINY